MSSPRLQWNRIRISLLGDDNNRVKVTASLQGGSQIYRQETCLLGNDQGIAPRRVR